MVASIDITGGDHGTDVGVWSTDSGSEGIATPCLHLHHHGGLPRPLRLPPLRRLPQTSQRRVHKMVEDKGQDMYPSSWIL